MFDDLSKAILTKYNSGAGATLRGILLGGFWLQIGPQDETQPYAVYKWSGTTVEDQMGTTANRFEKANMTFTVFSKQKDGASIVSSVINELISLYDWTDLTYTGDHAALASERTGAGPIDMIDDIWSGTLNYTFWFNWTA